MKFPGKFPEEIRRTLERLSRETLAEFPGEIREGIAAGIPIKFSGGLYNDILKKKILKEFLE